VVVSGVTPSLYNGTFIVTGLTGTTTSTITGASWTNGLATFTANNSYVVGQTVKVTGVTPPGYNGSWTGTATTWSTFTGGISTHPGTYSWGGSATGSPTGFTFTLPMTAVATASRATDAVTITAATWANTNGGTVTITAGNTFTAGQTVIITGVAPAGYSGT